MSLINNHNKLIVIADRDGWDVVECFEVDPLTKNDEKEKKLKTARKEPKELMKNPVAGEWIPETGRRQGLVEPVEREALLAVLEALSFVPQRVNY